jgi:hypothetical protein
MSVIGRMFATGSSPSTAQTAARTEVRDGEGVPRGSDDQMLWPEERRIERHLRDGK